MVVNVFLATSKDAIPPIAFFRCAKYSVGFDNTTSIPSASLLSAYAILKPQKSLNMESTLPNWASTWTSLVSNNFAKSECHRVFRVVVVRHKSRSLPLRIVSRDAFTLSTDGGVLAVPFKMVSYFHPLEVSSQKRSELISDWVSRFGNLSIILVIWSCRSGSMEYMYLVIKKAQVN